MRLAPLPPERLSPEQRRLYDDMLAVIEAHLQGFVAKRPDGALIGPFNPMLHFPQYGRAAWDYNKALLADTMLPKPVHEIAILVTGARFGARYEIYAHEHVAAAAGLERSKHRDDRGRRAAGRPDGREGVAFDAALSRGGTLSETTYRAAG